VLQRLCIPDHLHVHFGTLDTGFNEFDVTSVIVTGIPAVPEPSTSGLTVMALVLVAATFRRRQIGWRKR